jgi:type VI secretion system Hcp family effector
MLYRLICENEDCEEIRVILYRIEETTGLETQYFKYTFKHAKIISVENWMPPVYTTTTEEIGHLEKIKFLAKDIIWTHLDGGVEFEETVF